MSVEHDASGDGERGRSVPRAIESLPEAKRSTVWVIMACGVEMCSALCSRG